MSQLWPLITMLALGMILGAFYFMTLWQTVNRLPRIKNRLRLMVISYALRLTVLLTAFYFIVQNGHWERLVSALLGFVLMRVIYTRHVAPQPILEEIAK